MTASATAASRTRRPRRRRGGRGGGQSMVLATGMGPVAIIPQPGLERQFYRHFDQSRLVGRGHPAERGRVDARPDVGVLSVIERVEHLEPVLRTHLLRDLEVLEYAEV